VLSGLSAEPWLGGAKLKEHAMRTSQKTSATVSTIGIDVGKNTFHLVGLDKRGAIVLQQKVTRHQLGRRLSNIPRCLIGMESLFRHAFYRTTDYGTWSRCASDPGAIREAVPQGTQNDYRDAEAIAEAVQRPTMHFVSIKTRSRWICWHCTVCARGLSGRRTGVAIKSAAFCWSAASQCAKASCRLRKALPEILSSKSDALSPRMINLIGELIQGLAPLGRTHCQCIDRDRSAAKQDEGCQRAHECSGHRSDRLQRVVAAIGNGTGFQSRGAILPPGLG
jgi:hypothetical protein